MATDQDCTGARAPFSTTASAAAATPTTMPLRTGTSCSRTWTGTRLSISTTCCSISAWSDSLPRLPPTKADERDRLGEGHGPRPRHRRDHPPDRCVNRGWLLALRSWHRLDSRQVELDRQITTVQKGLADKRLRGPRFRGFCSSVAKPTARCARASHRSGRGRGCPGRRLLQARQTLLRSAISRLPSLCRCRRHR